MQLIVEEKAERARDDRLGLWSASTAALGAIGLLALAFAPGHRDAAEAGQRPETGRAVGGSADTSRSCVDRVRLAFVRSGQDPLDERLLLLSGVIEPTRSTDLLQRLARASVTNVMWGAS